MQLKQVVWYHLCTVRDGKLCLKLPIFSAADIKMNGSQHSQDVQ